MDTGKFPFSLKLTLSLLLLLIIGQVVFYFYSNNKISEVTKKLIPQNLQSPKLTDRNEVLKILSTNLTYLNFIDVTDYLVNEEDEPCLITTGCFEYFNESQDFWHAHLNKDALLPIIPFSKNYFVLKIDIRSLYGFGGLMLMPDEWFIENVETQNLFIGISEDNSKIIIEAKSDETGQKYILNDETKEKDFFTHMYLVLDRQGKYMAISDGEFSRMSKYIDINNVTGGAFPRGIFPYGEVYLGYNIAPGGYIYIPKISYAPF